MSDLKELTLRGMVLGALITIVFTASNVYLGLKVGLTFSSSIPAAVISMALLRFFAHSNILENNMVQTQASAAGTLSSVIFVLPGLLMIGYWQSFPFWQTMLICAAGGMLGVVFSIPLRHVMVVKSNLPYPEGVAAAEILKAGTRSTEKNSSTKEHSTQENSGLKDILFGAMVAAFVSFLSGGLRIVSGGAAYWFQAGKAIFQLPMGFSLALLSAGVLVGLTSGIAILIGTLIAWGVAIPILSTQTVMPEGMSIAQMGMQLWGTKIRYIGAGTISIAAIWTLLTLAKPMIEGIKLSITTMKNSDNNHTIDRVEQDLSPKMMALISLTMLVILFFTFYSFIASSGMSTGVVLGLVTVSVVFAFVMGFLVAAACGYMAGLVGSSASPISGIGIIAVTVVSLLLLAVGSINGMLETVEGAHFATALALFVTSTVLAMAAISNDNLQDLKTGYLIKATPWRQQVALLVGCVVGAIVIAPVLGLLYEAYGFAGAMPRSGMDESMALSAPQATLMMTIAKGIFAHEMDWSMIIIGIMVGIVIIALDTYLSKRDSVFTIPALAVGMGIYLPPSITMPLVLGAILSGVIKSLAKKRAQRKNLNSAEVLKQVEHKGTLMASGFIVGESLIGVIMAAIIVISVTSGGSEAPLSLLAFFTNIFGNQFELIAQWLGLAIFITICLVFVRRTLKGIDAIK